MDVFLNEIEYYLPKIILDNESLNQEFPEWSVDKIAEKTGIFQRHIADEDETASDMAIKAAEKLFMSSSIKKEEIKFILYCTQSPDYILPTTACLIQNSLGMSTNVGALDFNLGCSGYVYGLGVAKGLVMSGIASSVLLITSETYSKYIHPNDKSNRTIFGDAATASIISTKPIGMKAKIQEFSFGTDGEGANNLIIKNGGTKSRREYNANILTDKNGSIRSDDHLYMNGGEIFSFTSKAVPQLVNEVLLNNNCMLQNIDLFIFHQANQFMLNHIRQKIGIDKDKFYMFLETVGNTVSSTIPIALKEAFNEKGKIKEGNKVLLAGFGVGYSWGGTILIF